MSLSWSSITLPFVPKGLARKVRADGREKSLQVALPAHQVHGAVHFPQKRTVNFDSVPANAFSNNGQKFTVQLRRNDVDKIDHMQVKITIQVTGAPVVLPPVPYWFDRIDCRTAGDNQIVCTTYSDTMFSNIMTKCTKGRQRALFKNLNIESSENGFLGTTNALRVGTHTFYLPLIFSGFFESFDLYLADSKADLNFEFYPAATGIVSSGAGSVSVSNFQFLIENSKLTEKDTLTYKTQYTQYLREIQFVDPVLSPFQNKTLTAGAVNYFDMSNVDGLCSHHLILVRQSGTSSNVGNTQMRYLNLGDNEGAAIDLVDPAQQSMLGAGSAVPLKYVRQHGSMDSMDSDWVSTIPAYHLSYADNFGKSFSGIIDGAHKFDGSRQQLALTLPAAPIAEVQTITPSGAVSAGFYRFLYKGQLSVEIPYNATPAVMAAAFSAIKPAAARYITCSFSQALSAGAVVCTFTHPQTSGLDGELVQIVGNGLGASCSTAITTSGTAGLATGSYDVQVYSFIYRRGSYYNGHLRSDLLLA